MIERNEYGFPTVEEPQSLCSQILGFDIFSSPAGFAIPSQPSKWERARQYAAEARERNKPACNCDTCRQNERLPAVLNIIENWKKQ